MNKLLLIIILLILISNIKLSQSVSKKQVITLKKRSIKSEPEVVFLKDGAVRGIITDTHRVWYGIPFAKPPIGEFRFEDPQPVRPWRYIRDGTIQRDQCVQNCELGNAACSHIGTSEDCLYLDVFVPRTYDESLKLPVMMFIPGGAFTQGTGSCPLYDASHFANSSVIVVNINYRLGVLGFMGGDLANGNMGFLDQVRALQWIRDNIWVFGGNKDKITLYGQSAGGLSVMAHLVSEHSKGLFHRAIVSSAPLTVGLKTKSIARGFANRFASQLGCDSDIACFKSKSVDEILKAQGKTTLGLENKVLDLFTIWTPVVDCDIIPGQPLTMVRDGLIHDVPIIIGDVKDEATLFIYMTFKNRIDPLSYAAILSYLFPFNSVEVGIKYPCSLRLDCRPQLSKLLTDYLFGCPSRYLVNKLLKSHKSPVYHYQYKHDSSGDATIDQCEDLSCHGDELGMIFNTYLTALGKKLEDDEILMAQDLSNYWVNFITNNDPNNGISTPTMTTWSPITKTQNHSLVIESDLQSKDIITKDEKCNMFDKISYRRYTKPDAIMCPN